MIGIKSYLFSCTFNLSVEYFFLIISDFVPKKRLRKAIVESVACYGCEVWLLKTEEQRKLLALEMDYLRRSARMPRLQKIPNTAIRNKMQA